MGNWFWFGVAFSIEKAAGVALFRVIALRTVSCDLVYASYQIHQVWLYWQPR